MDKAALLRKRREQWARGREISEAVSVGSGGGAGFGGVIPGKSLGERSDASQEWDGRGGSEAGRDRARVASLADARMLSQLTDRIEQRLRSELQADPQVMHTREQNLRTRALARAQQERQEDDYTCPICYERMVAPRVPTMFFPCGHSFCSTCVHRHTKVNKKCCPICRAEIKTVAVNHHLKKLIEAYTSSAASSVVPAPVLPGLPSFNANGTDGGTRDCSSIHSSSSSASAGGGGAAGARYLREYNMLVTRRRIMVQERTETEAELRQLKVDLQKQVDVEEDLLAEEKVAADAVAHAKERLARVRARMEEQRVMRLEAAEKEQRVQAKLQMLVSTIKSIESDAEKAHVLCEASKQSL